MKSISFFDGRYPVKTIYTDVEDYKKTKHGKTESYIEYFKKELKLPIKNAVAAVQSHSANILAIDENTADGNIIGSKTIDGKTIGGRIVHKDETLAVREYEGYDAMITSLPGLMLIIRTADCAQVFLYDTSGHVCGLAHSGWRGTAKGIAPAAVKSMEECFGTKSKDVIAAFGPGICGHCYEVGAELIDPFRERFSDDDIAAFFVSAAGGKYHLDIKAAIRADLLKSGLLPENIYDTGICSRETEDFASVRRCGPVKLTEETLSAIMFY